MKLKKKCCRSVTDSGPPGKVTWPQSSGNTRPPCGFRVRSSMVLASVSLPASFIRRRRRLEAFQSWLDIRDSRLGVLTGYQTISLPDGTETSSKSCDRPALALRVTVSPSVCCPDVRAPEVSEVGSHKTSTFCEEHRSINQITHGSVTQPMVRT